MTHCDTYYGVFFLYLKSEVKSMVVYWDVVLVINFVFDFVLLMMVNLLLKRKMPKWRLVCGAAVGELSMASLWVNFDTVGLFIFKIFLSFLMTWVAFSIKDFKYCIYNVIYLYLVGIILGGFEYFLFNEFKVGSGFGLKYLIIIVLSPLVLAVYYKLANKLKNDYNNRHKLKIVYGEHVFEGVGYLDSGNKLVSPISGKPIVLVEKEYIVYHKLKLVPIPYNALNHHGLLYCFHPNELMVDGVLYPNVLVGLSEVKFNIDGCNALLNARMESL